MKPPIRVVIDTNLWISFLIGKTLRGLQDHIIRQDVVLIFSDELFDEIIEVVHRPKLRKYFSSDDIQELMALFEMKAAFIEIEEHVSDCRDAKDNFLLDLCISGNAEYLVTGDDDLISLNPFRDTKIIHYRDFEAILSRR